MWAEPRRCPFRERADGVPIEVAVTCAEAFIARNGYTLSPPAEGSAQLAEESFETGSSWPGVLARRRGSLEPRAVAVCVSASDRPDMAYTVVFNYRDLRVTNLVRIVTMDREYGRLRVQRQDVRVTALADDELGCRELPSRRGDRAHDRDPSPNASRN